MGHTHPSDGTGALGVVTRLARVGAEGAPRVGGHVSQVGRGKGGHKRALPRTEEPCSAWQGKLQSPALPTAAVPTKQDPGLFPRSLGAPGWGLGASQEEQGRSGCTWCHFRGSFTPPWCADCVSSSPSSASALPQLLMLLIRCLWVIGAPGTGFLSFQALTMTDLWSENYWS